MSRMLAVQGCRQAVRMLLGTLALFLITSHVYAQQKIACDTGTDCGPDPTRTTTPIYNRAVAARTQIFNQRHPANPTLVVSRLPLTKAVLASRSYDYSINLISLAGRNNTNVNLSLSYNSRIWSRSADGLTLNADIDNPSPGFRGIDFGFLQWNAGNSDWILTAANGGKSELVNVSGTSSYQSQDSTYLAFNASTNVVTYRDGTQVFYEQFGTAPFSSTSPLRPNKIENTNGNVITIAYVNTTSLSISIITDTLGRTINFAYDASGRLASISQGARTVTFAWNTTYVLNYQFSLPVIASPASGSVQSVLSSVTFADHSSVNFLYGDWGIVNRIERRSTNGSLRGYISYNFPAASAGPVSDAPGYTQQTVFDGVNTSVWNYAISENSAGLVTSSAVTDPLGTTTTTTFSSAGDWKDGLPLTEQVADASGKVWRTHTKTWTSDTGTSLVNPRIASILTQLDDGTESKVSYAYDSNGNVTDKQETDFGTSAPGPLLRETVTTYANLANHILNRPSQVLVKDATGIVSRTDFAYDEYTSHPLQIDIPSAIQHDDTNYSSTPTNARGNPTTITVYTNAGQATGAIQSIFTYDVFGNRISTQEGCCAQTHSVYTSGTQYGFPDSVSTGPASSQLTTSFTYNFNSGTVASSTDPNGQVTTFAYDTNNRITSVHTPDGVTRTTVYDDASANPGWTTSTTADSQQTTVVNDFDGHELSNKLYNGNSLISTISSSYDALGRVTNRSNAYGPSDTAVYTTYAYDALGRTTQHTPPALTAGVSQNSYQTNYSGHTTTLTDPTGRQQKEYRNAFGELVEVDEPGPGASTPGAPGTGSITISGSLHITSTTPGTKATGSFTVNGAESGVRTFICNDTCVRGPFVWDSGQVSVTVNGVTYSANYGQGSTASSVANALAAQFSGTPASASSPGTGATSTLTADQPGPDYSLSGSSFTNDPTDFGGASFGVTLSGSMLAGGVFPTTVYDSGTLAVTVNGFQASVSYGQNLNNTPTAIAAALASALNTSNSPVTATVNGATINMTAKGVGTATNYSVTGGTSTSFTATSTTLAGGTNPAGLFAPYVTNYSYDALGNLLQVNQGQQARTFTYDSLSRMTSMALPEKVNHAVTLTYTDFGAVATRTDARGITTTYGYDNLSRLTSTQHSDGTPTVNYSFGAAGAANFGVGRLTSTTDGAGSESYQYDSMGHVTKCTRVIGANTYVTSYTYTPDGRLASTTYPSGRVVSNQFDSIGRLSQVSTGGNSVINVNSYNAAGQVLTTLYGNGIQASYGYNNQRQVASILIGNATPLMNLSYNWGGASDDGLLLGVTDNLTSSRSTSYTYDQLKRLATAQTVDLTSPNTWQLQFTYDRYGNRLSQTPTGGNASMPSNTVVVDPATNRITNAVYDADGNMTSDGINTYTFDGENQITHVNGTANTYAYDGAGQRVNRNGNYYIYSGGRVIAEYANAAPAASPTTEYIYARNKRVATIAGGATTYPYWDHLSIRANANASGAVTRTFGHYPFGETWYETGTHDKWDYTTYENDSESGLNYAMARFHNPRLGRFISLDPVPASPALPQSLNRYTYGGNDPIGRVDPSGMAYSNAAGGLDEFDFLGMILDSLSPSDGGGDGSGDGGGGGDQGDDSGDNGAGGSDDSSGQTQGQGGSQTACDSNPAPVPCANAANPGDDPSLTPQQSAALQSIIDQNSLNPDQAATLQSLATAYCGTLANLNLFQGCVSGNLDEMLNGPSGYTFGIVVSDSNQQGAKQIGQAGAVMTHPCTYVAWFGGSATIGALGVPGGMGAFADSIIAPAEEEATAGLELWLRNAGRAALAKGARTVSGACGFDAILTHYMLNY